MELTRRGRALWREMNVSYRRAVQHRFATFLDDAEIAAVVGLNRRFDPVDE